MAKKVVGLLGAVLLIAGIAGFIDPLTPDGKVFGLFLVGEDSPVLHNMIHILSGLVALAAASSGEAYARLYAKVFGAVYALVTLLGFFTESGEKILGLIPINGADNLLHLGITVLLLYIGFAGDDSSERASARA